MSKEVKFVDEAVVLFDAPIGVDEEALQNFGFCVQMDTVVDIANNIMGYIIEATLEKDTEKLAEGQKGLDMLYDDLKKATVEKGFFRLADIEQMKLNMAEFFADPLAFCEIDEMEVDAV